MNANDKNSDGTLEKALLRIETDINTVEEAEAAEQAAITAIMNQGFSREEATRILHAIPTMYTEREIQEALKKYQSRPFSLLR